MKIYSETDRLIFREIVMDDAPALFDMDSDPEVHLYLGNNPQTNFSQSEDVVRIIRKQYLQNGIGRWAVVDKDSGELIGWSGLKYEQALRKEFDYYDLGYRIRKKYWGKGIATESARASLKYGFEVHNIDEICAAADINHIASNKILEKVGLKLIDTFLYDGVLHNWYKIKKDEWTEMNS